MKIYYTFPVLIIAIVSACTTHPTAPRAITTYANADLEKRTKQYDWVAVQITPQPSANHLAIKVYSRNDVKIRQTCRYEGTATWNGKGQYITQENIEFSFKDTSLIIAGAEAPLFYYCSGGASLAGTYEQI
ncbi:hypothetical protein [Wohlfahrtiimonas larvae]|uniref:Lipoprotein n=1 Tax=Wohlfahrtiimonas larvae TaxID=1157986 RepID=A0ABP9MMF6_9GAMM|nr:hypothetical protein [Wohlfahrtiimonas larvae]